MGSSYQREPLLIAVMDFHFNCESSYITKRHSTCIAHIRNGLDISCMRGLNQDVLNCYKDLGTIYYGQTVYMEKAVLV